MAPSVGNEQKTMSENMTGTEPGVPQDGNNPTNTRQMPPHPSVPQPQTVGTTVPGSTTITAEQYATLMAQYQNLASQMTHIASFMQTHRPNPQPSISPLQRPRTSAHPLREETDHGIRESEGVEELQTAYPNRRRSGMNYSDKRDLKRVMQEVRELKRVRTSHDLENEVDRNPLSLNVRREPIPSSIQIPKEKYDGVTDPSDHISCYETSMELYGATDAVKCRVFPATLKGIARSWYDSIPSQSVTRFRQLREMFLGHFSANKRQIRTLASLWFVTQRPNEPLRAYIKRFIAAYADVKHPNDSFAVQAFRAGVSNEHVHYALCGAEITTICELVSKAQTLAEAEEIRVGHTGCNHSRERHEAEASGSPRSGNKEGPSYM